MLFLAYAMSNGATEYTIFPFELFLYEILPYVSSTDKMSLCLVSKEWNFMIPIWIREIHIQGIPGYTRLSISQFRLVQRMSNLRILSLSDMKSYDMKRDTIWKNMHSLTSLSITMRNAVSSAVMQGYTLSKLTNLRTLKIVCDIDNMRVVGKLTKLRTLVIRPHNEECLLDHDISGMTNLKQLIAPYAGRKITHSGLTSLTNLKILSIDQNSTVTLQILPFLPKLEIVSFRAFAHASDNNLAYTPKLKKLSLITNNEITDNGLKKLIGLETLVMHANTRITDDGLLSLSSLRFLALYANDKITTKGIENHPYLENVILPKCHIMRPVVPMKEITFLHTAYGIV